MLKYVFNNFYILIDFANLLQLFWVNILFFTAKFQNVRG